MLIIKRLKHIEYILLILFICFVGCNLEAQHSQKLGKVTNPAITEISGITPYGHQNGYFWVHNDSGDGPFIYLIDSLANLKAKVEIDGFNAIDVEDIARFKYKNETYLLIADMGNNLKSREVLSLCIIKEPKVNVKSKLETIKIRKEKEIQMVYQDKPRDAEAIFVDPVDNNVYIFSKRDFESTVFSFPLDFSKNKVQILEPLQNLPFTFTTAADISADGKYIVAKNLRQIFLWERKIGVSILETLKNDPQNIPYIIEPQGEAICFDLNKRHLYTISERPFGLDSYLYKYDF